MSGIIVYYLVGPVHPRNLKLIADELPDWTFRATFERIAHWMTARTLAVIPFEKIPLARSQAPKGLWAGDVRAVIFSTTQPRRGPINLLCAAMERGIPTIAIEESNQIVFNNGTVNNYIMPVDHLLVASEYERQGMIEAGVAPERVEVTGWPFYAGQVGRVSPARMREMKQHFGLSPDRPVATLGLTALNDAGETPAVRERQLRLAAQGLPPEYQLAVKPHPIEKLEELMPFVAAFAPQAHVIDGMERIADVLEATDILLNRGRSQVSFEALYRDIPVIILDCGGPTPFHGLADELIVREPEDLVQALERISAAPRPMSLYSPVKHAHIPHPPGKARKVTSKRIEKIAFRGKRKTARPDQWFALAVYQGFVGSYPQALESLEKCAPLAGELPVDALRNLLLLHADQQDIKALETHTAATFLGQIVRCIWIDQLRQRGKSPTDSEIAWMKGFPPPENTAWFVEHLETWADILLRAGRVQAARDLAHELGTKYLHIRRLPALVRAMKRHSAGLVGRAQYLLWRANRRMRAFLRELWVRLKA